MLSHRVLCCHSRATAGLCARFATPARRLAPSAPVVFSAVMAARLSFSTSRPQLQLRHSRLRLGEDRGARGGREASETLSGQFCRRRGEASEEPESMFSKPSKEYGTNEEGSIAASSNRSKDDDDGFHEDAIVVKDEKGNSITRVRRLPLTLIEEVPLPQRVLTELELIMMAWSEEHARQYGLIMMFVRISIVVLITIVLYVFYRTQISSERTLRGVDNIPTDLRIGNVVYFDVTEDGVDIGRIVIGLLTEDCPLYCEYFHRRCTGSGSTGESFRGLRMSAIIPRHCLIFGEGREMTHEVPGFNPNYLPTEHLSNGAWRGALSSITYGPDRESPNFIIHVSSGDYKPQVFGLIIGGYNVVERMNQAGSKHGNSPKRGFVISECGELCTLAKSHIVPMPWRLYESISKGYDEEKFGAKLPHDVLVDSDARGAQVFAKMHSTEAPDAAHADEEKTVEYLRLRGRKGRSTSIELLANLLPRR